MNISYTLSGDPSGYSSAARADILSLYVSGVNITTQIVKQMAEQADYGLQGDIVRRLQGRSIPHKIHIIHLTPDLLPTYKNQGEYVIARLAWETDRLPKEWIAPLTKADEIWTMSEQMQTMIAKSGVKTKTFVFPQAIDTTTEQERISPFVLPVPTDFVFYTIAQWITRKNFKTLLAAYWQAFSGNSDVALLIKTYRINYSQPEQQLIKHEIEQMRKDVPLSHYPRLLLTKHVFTDAQIHQLHALGNCYVNPSSGEGWCRPMAEAMLAGKPVISADNGGITDYLTEKEYIKVNTEPVHAAAQSHIPWYTGDMLWREIDKQSLVNALQQVYSNYAHAKEIGEAGQRFVLATFSPQTVGGQMKKRLEEIGL